jgi:hypothetical protein
MHEHADWHTSWGEPQGGRVPSPTDIPSQEADLLRRVHDVAGEYKGAAAERSHFERSHKGTIVRTTGYSILEHSVQASQETVRDELCALIRQWNALMRTVTSERQVGLDPGNRERRYEIYTRLRALAAKCALSLSIALETE